MTTRAASCIVASLVAIAAALLPIRSAAHPPWGLVVDADGCVFHSDLSKIIRRSADGSESHSPRVHAHALTLSPEGDVVGEETEYLGADRYRHRVWTWGHGRMKFGRWSAGFGPSQGIHRFADGSSVRDVCSDEVCRIVRDDGATSIVLHEAPRGSRIRALAVTPGGRIVFVEDDAVLTLDDYTASHIARARPNRFGVFADDCGNVLATSHGDGVVEWIRDGSAEVVYTSTPPWAPTGVAAAADGLRVLEVSTSNEVRVIHAPVNIPACGESIR